jgi:hypothetical protein
MELQMEVKVEVQVQVSGPWPQESWPQEFLLVWQMRVELWHEQVSLSRL